MASRSKRKNSWWTLLASSSETKGEWRPICHHGWLRLHAVPCQYQTLAGARAGLTLIKTVASMFPLAFEFRVVPGGHDFTTNKCPYVRLSAKPVIQECDNCRRTFKVDDETVIPLEEVEGLGERLDAGSVVPSGECPDCGALTYYRADAEEYDRAKR